MDVVILSMRFALQVQCGNGQVHRMVLNLGLSTFLSSRSFAIGLKSRQNLRVSSAEAEHIVAPSGLWARLRIRAVCPSMSVTFVSDGYRHSDSWFRWNPCADASSRS